MNPKTTRLSISLFILFTFLLSSLPQARADIISLLKTLEKKQNKGVSADKPKMAPSTSSGQADPEKKPLKDKPFKEELKPTTADKAEPINVLSEFQWSSKLRAKKGFLDQLQYAGQNNSSPLIAEKADGGE